MIARAACLLAASAALLGSCSDDVALPLIPEADGASTTTAPTPTVSSTVPARGDARDADPAAHDEANAEDAALAAGRRFLQDYSTPHGRVIRHDQGGDTVSEGQAYAMLIAVAIEDEATFAATWSWTKDHLMRTDGLLAWRWADGVVADRQVAADADLDAVHALLLAAERFGEPAYRDDAIALADALHENLVVSLDAGRLLVAGHWAVAERRWNPSYLSPLAFSVLYRHADDHRWAEVASTSRVLIDRLTADPPHLPPDWALLTSNGPVSTGDPATYGYDAVRTPLRLALDCDPYGVDLAARAWPTLAELTAGGTAAPPAVVNLDGSSDTTTSHPAATVGAAASARAAGDDEAAARLLALAEEQDRAQPTYYGSALVALGRLGLETDRLGACG